MGEAGLYTVLAVIAVGEVWTEKGNGKGKKMDKRIGLSERLCE